MTHKNAKRPIRRATAQEEVKPRTETVYRLDEEEREALARSAEDLMYGRFASDAEIEEIFGRYAV